MIYQYHDNYGKHVNALNTKMNLNFRKTEKFLIGVAQQLIAKFNHRQILSIHNFKHIPIFWKDNYAPATYNAVKVKKQERNGD